MLLEENAALFIYSCDISNCVFQRTDTDSMLAGLVERRTTSRRDNTLLQPIINLEMNGEDLSTA